MLETPILFLVFNRPSTTAKVFEEIRRARPARLFVAADGPRPDRSGDAEACRSVREIATAVDWECQVSTLFREQNLGCREAVSSALDWFFGEVEEGIILEDDCLPSQGFYSFCEAALQQYRNDLDVMHINGSNFISTALTSSTCHFTRVVSVWGWATWRRAWRLYDRKMSGYDRLLDAGEFKRMFPRGHKPLLPLLKKIKSGVINTWDAQWQITCYDHGGLCLEPDVNLIKNIGFGADATHLTGDDPRASVALGDIFLPLQWPGEKEVDIERDDQEMLVCHAPSFLAQIRSSISYFLHFGLR